MCKQRILLLLPGTALIPQQMKPEGKLFIAPFGRTHRPVPTALKKKSAIIYVTIIKQLKLISAPLEGAFAVCPKKILNPLQTTIYMVLIFLIAGSSAFPTDEEPQEHFHSDGFR